MPRRKKIGVSRATYIKAHKKTTYTIKQTTKYGPQKQSHKTQMSARFARRRYWGPAEPIPEKPILKFEWRYTKDQINEMLDLETLPIPVEKAMKRSGRMVFDWYTDVKQSVLDGCKIGYDLFTKNISQYIPQRSGFLRKNIEETVNASLPATKGQKDLPVTINIGAPAVQYASVVNKYTPQFIQLQHSAGKQMSGVPPHYWYNARLGDPKAQFHFFAIVSMQCRKSMKDGIKSELDKYGIPWAIFVFYIKVTERTVNIV